MMASRMFVFSVKSLCGLAVFTTIMMGIACTQVKGAKEAFVDLVSLGSFFICHAHGDGDTGGLVFTNFSFGTCMRFPSSGMVGQQWIYEKLGLSFQI